MAARVARALSPLSQPQGPLGPLEPVRSARFRRVEPVVPDRAALGAPVQQQAEPGQTKHEDVPTQHHPPIPTPWHHTGRSQAFSSRRDPRQTGDFAALVRSNAEHQAIQEGTTAMPSQPEAEFGISEARRILGEVFAPWVQDLNLSVERIEHLPPPDVPDWQPAALLRMPFSERLCRNGGVVCGQALMALADTAMVIANLAANRGYRPMTTVDQTTHFMRAVSSSDVL